MGVLTYIKIGAAVVLLGVASYFVYEYKHMATTIKTLNDKVAGLELRAEVIEKAQATTDAFMKKKTTVQGKATNEKAEIDQTIQAGDNAHLRDLFVNHGLLAPSKTGPPPSRAPGHP